MGEPFAIQEFMDADPKANRAALQAVMSTTNAYTIPRAMLPDPVDKMGDIGRIERLVDQRTVNTLNGTIPVFSDATVAFYAEPAAPPMARRPIRR